MKNKARMFLDIAVAAFAAAAIICISVTAVVSFRPLYYFDIGALSIAERAGLTEEVVKANYDALIDYNLLGGPSELQFPTMSMSEEGRIHFEEVKDIFISMQLVSIAAAVILLIWIFVRLKNKRASFRWMKLTGIAVAAIAAIVGLAALIDWNGAFTAMHKIFFRNDYWIFDAETDPVINILPEEFFMHCGMAIILLAALQTAALRLAYRRLEYERKRGDIWKE